MAKKKLQKVYEIEVIDHNEFGNIYRWKCPDCGYTLSYVTYGYSDIRCSCGKIWDLTFFASCECN